MTDRTHTSRELVALREIVDGAGGTVAVVSGPDGPYFAGVRRPPAKTLLEAILSVMADRSRYERIAVFSARGEHLPAQFAIGLLGSFEVGQTSGGWLLHGPKPETRPNAVGAPASALAEGVASPLLQARRGWFRPNDRILFRQSDSNWLVEVEQCLTELETLLGFTWSAGCHEQVADVHPRSLILLDDVMLRPRTSHLQAADHVPEQVARQMQKRFAALPELVQRVQADLVMFTRRADTAGRLKSGTLFHDDVKRFLEITQPQAPADEAALRSHPLAASFPAVGWERFVAIDIKAVSRETPQGAFLPGINSEQSLLSALKTTRLQYSSPMDALNRMIGIEAVKAEFKSFMSQAEAQVQRTRHGLTNEPMNLNMAFYGNPGTGKTEVARIFGRAIADLGLLSGGKFTEAGPQDLIGEYVGQSRQKVQAVCQRAMGGVLFIDEAYELTPTQSNSFAEDSVVALLLWMNNHPRDIAFILAGYPDRMDNLFRTANDGLKRRVPSIIRFPDYDDPTLVEICERMCTARQYLLAPGCRDAILDQLQGIRTMRSRSAMAFGNAGEVKNLLERSIRKHSDRVYATPRSDISKAEMQTLQPEDFVNAEIS